MLTENHKRGDSIALTEGLLIAVRRLSGDGLALSVIACAMPPLPKGEALACGEGRSTTYDEKRKKNFENIYRFRRWSAIIFYACYKTRK